MRLYLISQKVNNDYDTYDSAIVAAPDEETARDINPSDGKVIDWGDDWFSGSWVHDRKDVAVKYIGEAVEGTEQGLILASFNAG